MKAFAKRIAMLVVLTACAVGWVFLMGLDLSRQGSVRGSDGSRATVTYLDETEFPRITAYLSVVDGSDQPITNLDQGAFALTEDGIPVDIENFVGAGQQPVVAVLVIDHSGSMEKSGKMEGAQAAAHAFLDQLQAGRDRVGVIAFHDSVSTLFPLNLMSEADREPLRDAISRLRPEQNTAYYDAVQEAIMALRSQTGRKVVIALTDGLDNRSRHSLKSTIKFAQENNVPVYTIGLGGDVLESQLRTMASETGGKYYFSPDASQLASLYQDLAQTLQNEYSLTYTSPTPRRDGTRRDVVGTVEHPGAALSAVGDYNPGGVLSVSLNLPLLIGMAIPLMGLLLLPGAVGLLKRRRDGREHQRQPPYEPSPPYGDASTGLRPKSPEPSSPGYLSPPKAQPPAASHPPGQVSFHCTRCGQPLRPGARFCPRCGQPRAAR